MQVAHFLHIEHPEAIMKIRTVFAMSFVCAALLFPNASLSAHHAMLAEFNVREPITVKGTLTKMEWKNPHGWIPLM